jgi:hypothetical protein
MMGREDILGGAVRVSAKLKDHRFEMRWIYLKDGSRKRCKIEKMDGKKIVMTMRKFQRSESGKENRNKAQIDGSICDLAQKK